MNSELEQLKTRGEEADREKIRQSALEEMRKKSAKKKTDRTKRKSKVQPEGMNQKE